MAGVSTQREGGGGGVRYAALNVGINGVDGSGSGSSGGGGEAMSSSKALPSSPLARRPTASASATARETNGGGGFFDKEPLLPLSYKDASSGDLHGHYKRVVSVEHRVRNALGLSRTVVAGSAYCIASTSMVLLNKAALSSFGFGSPTALLLFQCTVCTCAAAGAGALGLSRLERPTPRLARAWAPVSVLFVGMVWSSVFALRDLGVPMVTVLKNLTNLFTIVGDYALFGRVYGRRVWATLALMALSALCGAATDLEFSAAGYGWQIANCAFTSAYSLALRLLMERGGEGVLWGSGSGDTASSSSPSPSSSSSSTQPPPRRRLNELSMVFYNNALSLPLIALLAWARGDLGRASTEPALGDPRFLAAAGASAALAFGISFTSLWFLSTTTATTFSLVGSLNKVPVAAVGLVAFGVPATAQNVAAIAVGLVASAVFVWAKQGDSGKQQQQQQRRGGGGGGGGDGGGVGSGNSHSSSSNSSGKMFMMRDFYGENGGGDRGEGGAIGTSVVVVGGSGGGLGGSLGGGVGGGGGSPGGGSIHDEAPGSGSKALRR